MGAPEEGAVLGPLCDLGLIAATAFESVARLVRVALRVVLDLCGVFFRDLPIVVGDGLQVGDHRRGVEDPDLDLPEPDLVLGGRGYGVGAALGRGEEGRAVDHPGCRVDLEARRQGRCDRYRRGEQSLVEGRVGGLEAHLERELRPPVVQHGRLERVADPSEFESDGTEELSCEGSSKDP